MEKKIGKSKISISGYGRWSSCNYSFQTFPEVWKAPQLCVIVPQLEIKSDYALHLLSGCHAQTLKALLLFSIVLTAFMVAGVNVCVQACYVCLIVNVTRPLNVVNPITTSITVPNDLRKEKDAARGLV